MTIMTPVGAAGLAEISFDIWSPRPARSFYRLSLFSPLVRLNARGKRPVAATRSRLSLSIV